MTKMIAFPEGMDYRAALKFTDALMIGDTEVLDKEKPEYTYLEDIRNFLAYKLAENEDGFLTGPDLKAVNERLGKLCLGNIGNVDNVPDFEGLLADLFAVDKYNRLNYNCVRVENWRDDFPPDLRETDEYGYVFTNRNDKYGIQIVVGAQSGYQFSRRMNNLNLTGWTAIRGDTIYYATFDINVNTGMLEMYTEPDYTGANFTLENENLVVTV